MMEMFSNWADWTPQLFRGLQVSLRLVGLALLFGLPLGLALALASSEMLLLAQVLEEQVG